MTRVQPSSASMPNMTPNSQIERTPPGSARPDNGGPHEARTLDEAFGLLLKMTRYDTPKDHSPPKERRLEIRLLKWPMWKDVPWWSVRIGWPFVMVGPYELRVEYHGNKT